MTDVGVLSTAHLHADAYVPLLREMDGVTFVGVADDDEVVVVRLVDEQRVDATDLLGHTP